MIRKVVFVLALLFHSENSAGAQALKIPRELNKLVLRAQDFWTAMAANQRLKALEFVLPEKKEFLLSSGGMPFVNPQVIGIDFTGDTNRASVRVSVKAIARDAPSGQLSWIVTDTWVWDRNNWFLDLQDPKNGINPFASSGKAADHSDQLRAEAESRFKILDTLVDVGTVKQGDVQRIPVRFEYSGDVPVSIRSGLSSDVMGVESSSTQSVTAQSKEFGLLLNTEAWDGPFAIPFPLKIQFKGVTIDRTVLVKGNIFTPISVAQKPSPFMNSPGQELTLTLRNNTNEAIPLISVGSEGNFEVVSLPENIPAGGQVELILRLKSNARADVNQQIHLNLGEPLQGKRIFDLRVRVRP